MICLLSGYYPYTDLIGVWKGTEEEAQEAAEYYRTHAESGLPDVIYFFTEFAHNADFSDVIRPLTDGEL